HSDISGRLAINKQDASAVAANVTICHVRSRTISAYQGLIITATENKEIGTEIGILPKLNRSSSTTNWLCAAVEVAEASDCRSLPSFQCARCGPPVDSPYCHTYFQNFQNTSESSDDGTNVVNAPRKPFVFKQDHSVNSSQNPPHIDECCYECGDALDGIFCQQCTCKSCGKGAHIGYNFPPKVPIISNPEPCNRTMNIEPPQTLPSFDPTCYSEKENSLPCVLKPDFVDESPNELAEYINTPGWNHPTFYNNGDDDDVDYTIAITPVLSIEEPDNSIRMGDEHLDTIPATESDEVIKSSVKDLVPIPSESEGIPDTMCDVHLVNNPIPLEAKDHFEIVINSNNDYSSSDDDSLYNENIKYVEASPYDSELVSLEVAEIVIPEDEEIEDDNLREKLLNVNFIIAKIEALKDNPTPSSEFLTKSSSTSPKSFLEETNTFDNSLPEFENFCFDLEEISSGSTTTHSDISLPDYEAFYFYDDQIEEISSGNTTTHSDISLYEYDSFIFDLSNDQFPPTDRSDFTHEEFADELAHIISPPEYDCFYFRNLPDPDPKHEIPTNHPYINVSKQRPTSVTSLKEYHRREREDSRGGLLESEDSVGGRHWKRSSRRSPRGGKDDLSEPYDE
nr:hypothetical protein [Tanacetum cinerariifolium]